MVLFFGRVELEPPESTTNEYCDVLQPSYQMNIVKYNR